MDLGERFSVTSSMNKPPVDTHLHFMDTNAQHIFFPNLAVCKFCAETNDANLTMTVFDSS